MVSGTRHLACIVLLVLFSRVVIFMSFSMHESLEKKQECEIQGGALVAVSLPQTDVLVFDSDFLMAPDEELKSATIVCIPRNCATAEQINDQWCMQIKGWVMQLLWDQSLHYAESENRGGFEGWCASTLRNYDNYDWMVHGGSSQDAIDFRAQRFLELDFMPRSLRRQHVSDGLQFRVAVISIHAPLAFLMAEHIRWEFVLANRGDQFVTALYAVCYLCAQTVGCMEGHVPSQADRACDFFHRPDEASFEFFHGIAQDVTQRELGASVVMCFGAAICHFVFSILPPSITRMQLLCMNPLHDVPKNLAGLVLLDLDRRLQAGEVILTTNGVTSALLSYHLGREIPSATSVTLFRSDLFTWAMQSSRESKSTNVLLGSSFLLQACSLYWLFRSALQDSLPDFTVIEHKHDRFWSLSSQTDVDDMLQYAYVIYIPEHPYKNYFNDFYAMRLPIFLPTLEFLTNFLIGVDSLDDNEIYEGWFARRIARTRLSAAGFFELPEPFDLRAEAKQKVRSWFQFADYFHFPGLFHFAGIADLARQLQSPDVGNAASNAIDIVAAHVISRRAFALDQFRRLVEQVAV